MKVAPSQVIIWPQLIQEGLCLQLAKWEQMYMLLHNGYSKRTDWMWLSCICGSKYEHPLFTRATLPWPVTQGNALCPSGKAMQPTDS